MITNSFIITIILNTLLCALIYFFGRLYNKKHQIVDLLFVIFFIALIILNAYSDIRQVKKEYIQEIIEDYQNGKIDCETTIIKVNDEIVSTEKKYYYKNEK